MTEHFLKRMGGFKAAEKCRDRAVAFYNNGYIIHAIDHLHRAKISWFSAETLRGTILTTRFIADCYNQLGLVYAAKYYLFSSFYLAFHSNDEDVHDLVSRSLFQAAETFYESGEWLSFFAIMQVALMTPSMRIALEDLKLEHITVVYPGKRRYSIHKKIDVVPFDEIIGGMKEAKNRS